ncbi:hypothetical protein cypCar_00025981 [Cyprinus carpio]|nr:hypothetical protein cypCar_00025981 [Cyprinus carpio]
MNLVNSLLPQYVYLSLSSGFSAEISVFVQTGDSVQLDIQTQELPEFDDLSWRNNKSENMVKYFHKTKEVRLHSSYKDRVDFNNKTLSLTLKNMQKTDSGLYTARTSGESDNNIVTYRVSVIDAVEAPVLTVNSNWSSSDSCTVNFTCRAHELMIDSSYQNNRCFPEKETSQINTLILDCSEESIICNHSNPVSWKKDRINITQLCFNKDAVEAPVLTVNSNLSSPDPCNYTCNGSNIIISFIYNSSSCSPEEVTSDHYTLRLSCIGDSIMCNYSNPVSWKTDTKKVNELCTVNQSTYCIHSDLKQTATVCILIKGLFSLSSGFSAEISVFVQTGDSVQLDIQTQELPEFDLLSWSNDKSENIVKYLHKTKVVRLHSSYKDRVDFNNKTFSLTLKNMEKTHSGLYTARTSGESDKNIGTYRVSVIDAVEAPVLDCKLNYPVLTPVTYSNGSNIINQAFIYKLSLMIVWFRGPFMSKRYENMKSEH